MDAADAAGPPAADAADSPAADAAGEPFTDAAGEPFMDVTDLPPASTTTSSAGAPDRPAEMELGAMGPPRELGAIGLGIGSGEVVPAAAVPAAPRAGAGHR